MRAPFGSKVLSAIDFDRQLRRRAVEVQHIGTDRILTPKLGAAQPPVHRGVARARSRRPCQSGETAGSDRFSSSQNAAQPPGPPTPSLSRRREGNSGPQAGRLLYASASPCSRRSTSVGQCLVTSRTVRSNAGPFQQRDSDRPLNFSFNGEFHRATPSIRYKGVLIRRCGSTDEKSLRQSLRIIRRRRTESNRSTRSP
jgi:hypothetical protein